MQEHPLIVSELLEYAVRVHGSREIVSRTIEDPSKVHRCVLHAAGRLVARSYPVYHFSPGWRARELVQSSRTACLRLSLWRCPLPAE